MVVGVGFVILLLVIVIIAVDRGGRKRRLAEKDAEDAEFKIVDDKQE